MSEDQKKIGIALSEFYPEFSQLLIEGVLRVLQSSKFQIHQVKVPGASELPLALHWLFKHQRCSAVIGLGAVIQGETSHYDSVCRIVEQGFLKVQFKWSKPVVSGVIMAESLEQVRARLSEKKHKGEEAARACLKMLSAFSQLQN